LGLAPGDDYADLVRLEHIDAFFRSGREARRVRGVEKATPKASISQAAVLGCGTMGGGIAMCFANAGIPVRVTETEQGALDRGMDKIRGNYASTVSKGRLSAAEAEARLALIEPTLDFDCIADADIVIGIPDSALAAAAGYAEASGLPYRDGLVRNRYTLRRDNLELEGWLPLRHRRRQQHCCLRDHIRTVRNNR